MKPRHRFSIQKNQELTSKAQFQELISSVGWVSNIIETDLGQDIYIDIYNDGVSSGLSFQVQLKSTSNIMRYKNKDDTFRYSFDTDDLKHWFQQMNTVYIVLWDINIRQGWFIPIDVAIKHLNTTSPRWHSQKTATVHFSLKQLMDKQGLDQIKILLTTKALPIFLDKGSLDIKFTFAFPKDDVSQMKHRELINAIETGVPFEVEKNYIQQIDMPDWWVRLLGAKNSNALSIKWSSLSSVSLPPVRIELSSPRIGAVTIDFVELKVIQLGTKQATVSNENQLIPYKFWFKFNWDRRDGATNISINLARLDAVEAKKALDFIRILAFGGEMNIRRLDTHASQGFILQPNPSLLPSERQIKFIGNIAKIQTAFGIMIFLPDNTAFTNIDFDNSEKILKILETGSYRKYKDIVKFNLVKDDISRISKSYVPGEYYELITNGIDMSFDVLSISIPLGLMKRTIKGKCDIPIKAFNDWLTSAKRTDMFELELSDVNIIEEYEAYLK